jgi:hypothetical protein
MIRLVMTAAAEPFAPPIAIAFLIGCAVAMLALMWDGGAVL